MMANQKVDGIEVEISLSSGNFVKDLDAIENRTQQSVKKMTASGKDVAQFGQSLTIAGQSLTNSITTPLMNVAKSGVETALSFETSMAKVHTIMDTSVMSLDDMGIAIKDLSSQTGISADEIADNVYNAISAGQSTGDAVNFVTNSTKLAKAGFAEAGESLDLLTTILNSYGMEANEVNKVSDILIQTQNLGKTTVAELSSSMGKIIPTANAFGVGLEQISSGYALMTSKGIATAETTTYMNSMLNELGKSGTKVSDIIKKETGQSFQELMESGSSLGDVLNILQGNADKSGLSMADLFGSAEAGKAALILASEGGSEFNAILDEMGNSLGATDEAFEKVNNTTAQQMQVAFNDLKNTVGDVMAQMLPLITSLVEKFSGLLDWFKNLSPVAQKFGLMLTGVAMAIGPLITFIGSLITVFAPLITAITTAGGVTTALGGILTLFLSPIGLVIAGVGALALAFVTDFGNIRTNTMEILNNLKELVSIWWEAFKNMFGDSLEAIKYLVETVFVAIQAIINAVMTTIKGIVNTIMKLIQGDWQGAWETIKETVKTVLTIMKNIVVNLFDAIVDVVISIGLDLANAMYNSWTQAKEKAVQVWNDLCNWFKGAINDPIGTIKGIGSSMYSAGRDMFNSVWEGCKSIWDSISDWFTSKINWIKDKLLFWRESRDEMNSGSGGSGGGRSAGYSAQTFMARNMPYASVRNSTNNNNLSLRIDNFVNNSANDIEFIAQELAGYYKKYSLE